MKRPKPKPNKDLYLERMFETRSDEWARVGLSTDVSEHELRRARREVLLLVPLMVGVIVVFNNRQQLFGIHAGTAAETLITAATVILLLGLGWTIARDIGRAAGPTLFRRMDPGTAGTVGFLIRLATLGVTVLVAFGVAGVSTRALVAGGAVTAVVLGLAAQQTLGNLFAGLVLLSARPFRVGERIRLQAGVVGGTTEGIVSSLGLMYTTLVQEGEDRIMIPNNVVLASAVLPRKEPDPVDVRVRLPAGMRPSHVQAILDHRVETPTRRKAEVVLEEIQGDEIVVRVQATPQTASDGAKLADEIIEALAALTAERATAGQ
jgi:small-conductance mechanosensitive channel